MTLEGTVPHKRLTTEDGDLAARVAEALVDDGEMVTVAPPEAVQGEKYIIETSRWE